MQNFGLIAFGIAFWAFMAVAAVAGIVSDYKKRQLELEPLRAAIERGAQLDPAVIEKLMTREPRASAIDPMDLKVGGIITIAAGIGLALLSVFISQVVPVALWWLLGAGTLALCVGVGLLLAARTLQRQDRGPTA
jgi:hypothetical protein